KPLAIFLVSLFSLVVGLAEGRAQDVEACYRNRTASQWLQALRTSDAQGRAEAAYCLGQMRAEAAAPLLQDVAQKDPDHFVRAEAVYALGNIPPRSALPLVARLIKQDPITGVRGAAATALGNMGGDAGLIVPILIAALQGDKSEYVRGCAALALGRIG